MDPSQPRTSPPLTLQCPRLGLLHLWTDLLQDVVVLLGLEFLRENEGFAAHLWKRTPFHSQQEAPG